MRASSCTVMKIKPPHPGLRRNYYRSLNKSKSPVILLLCSLVSSLSYAGKAANGNEHTAGAQWPKSDTRYIWYFTYYCGSRRLQGRRADGR